MQDTQANLDYWAGMTFDFGIRSRSMPYNFIWVGASRTLMLNSPIVGGNRVFNMGLSSARISTLTTNILPQLKWMQPEFLLMDGLGCNECLIPDQTDPEFVNVYSNMMTFCQATRSILPNAKIAMSSFMPLEKGNATIGNAFDALALAPIMDKVNGANRSVAATCGFLMIDIDAMFRGADLTALPGMTADQAHYSQVGSPLIISALSAQT
jgi:hypothetical protein